MFGQRLQGVPVALTGNATYAAGGRYLIGGARVYDVRTGTVRELEGYPVSADPIRPRVFLLTAGDRLQVLDLDSGEQRDLTSFLPWATDGLCSWFPYCRTARYSARADRLWLVRGTGLPGMSETVGVDVATGTVTVTGAGRFVIDVSADGTRLLVGGGLSPLSRLAMLAAETSEPLADLAVPFTVDAVMWDQARQRIYVSWRSESGAVMAALDDNLQLIGQVALPGSFCGVPVVASPGTGRILLLPSKGLGSYYGPLDIYLTALADTDGALLQDVNLSLALGMDRDRHTCFPRTLFVPLPAPPLRVSGETRGSAVTLRWQNPGNATSFVLEIGLAPGRSDGSISLAGADESVSFASVPPGTYYARVRGKNEVGIGPASAEVMVVVGLDARALTTSAGSE